MTYICDNVPDDVTIDQFDELQWKTEPPTVEGWYWYFGGGENEPYPEYVYFDEKESGLCINVLGFSLRVDEGKRYWLGPLPIPEPPK